MHKFLVAAIATLTTMALDIGILGTSGYCMTTTDSNRTWAHSSIPVSGPSALVFLSMTSAVSLGCNVLIVAYAVQHLTSKYAIFNQNCGIGILTLASSVAVFDYYIDSDRDPKYKTKDVFAIAAASLGILTVITHGVVSGCCCKTGNFTKEEIIPILQHSVSE